MRIREAALALRPRVKNVFDLISAGPYLQRLGGFLRDYAVQLDPERQRLNDEANRLREEAESLRKAAGDTRFPGGHYYSPLPSLAEVRERESKLFGPPPRTLPGIDLNEQGQLDLLEAFKRFTPECPFGGEQNPRLRSTFRNDMYCATEGSVIYYMMQHFQPKRIIEIGSGYSTCFTLDINELFFRNQVECTCIEPEPERLFSMIRPEDRANVHVLESRLQEIPLARFADLHANDVLFIDSTHVSKIGSDVNYILFEILPSLRKGVVIHMHDIFYPFEYPRDWLYQGFAWNEAYALRSFLQYNHEFRIIFFHDFLLRFHRERLLASFPMLSWGQNIWLTRE